MLGTTLHVDVGAELATRSEAVGSWANLVPSATLVAITAIVWWTTRKTGPARTPEDGEPTRGTRAAGPEIDTLTRTTSDKR
ncbi:hypothetical protein L6E12_04050 [Actinokineospora sp. PR83]|uniref:hypothetical protein n=1 Tax=Actinokineospora sp. PR83 TaxID=2884908 RepID=UPI001F40D74E|nr:hypothetical protein [Actinokineospora sp. PR83]MCG8914962.1 hypothetical protein [Actinokineospora sp. PR83]